MKQRVMLTVVLKPMWKAATVTAIVGWRVSSGVIQRWRVSSVTTITITPCLRKKNGLA